MSARIVVAGSRHARSVRPASSGPEFRSQKQPASTKRVHLKRSREEVAEFARRVQDIPPENR
jgi:uncharacterized protein